MTKEELDLAFTKNYKKYSTAVNNHIFGIYEIDIAMSHLYMDLVKKLNELTNENLLGYVVQFGVGLKRWRKNKPVSLTEYETKTAKGINDEGEKIELLRTSYVDSEVLDSNEGDTTDYEQEQWKALEAFIKQRNINRIDATLLRDFFIENLDSSAKMSTFYGRDRTFGRRVYKEVKELLEQFKNFIKEDYSI